MQTEVRAIVVWGQGLGRIDWDDGNILYLDYVSGNVVIWVSTFVNSCPSIYYKLVHFIVYKLFI